MLKKVLCDRNCVQRVEKCLISSYLIFIYHILLHFFFFSNLLMFISFLHYSALTFTPAPPSTPYPLHPLSYSHPFIVFINISQPHLFFSSSLPTPPPLPLPHFTPLLSPTLSTPLPLHHCETSLTCPE